jgi:hypothetical protein
MYGWPADLDLTDLIERRLDTITIAEFVISLAFDEGWNFTLMAEWRVADGGGRDLDSHGRDTPYSATPCIGLTPLVGSLVKVVEIKAPRELTLTFSTMHRLTLIDDPDVPYESFIIRSPSAEFIV